METETIWSIIFLGGIPLGILLYRWYMKARADDSPGGKAIIWDEFTELMMDANFWDAIDEVRGQVADEDE